MELTEDQLDKAWFLIISFTTIHLHWISSLLLFLREWIRFVCLLLWLQGYLSRLHLLWDWKLTVRSHLLTGLASFLSRLLLTLWFFILFWLFLLDLFLLLLLSLFWMRTFGWFALLILPNRCLNTNLLLRVFRLIRSTLNLLQNIKFPDRPTLMQILLPNFPHKYFKRSILIISSNLTQELTQFLINQKSLPSPFSFIQSIKYFKYILILGIRMHRIWLQVPIRLTNSTKDCGISIWFLFTKTTFYFRKKSYPIFSSKHIRYYYCT